MTGPHGGRAPISWEALAAELATELTGEADEAAAGQPVEAWDAAAARLAAGLGAPAAAPDTAPDTAPADVRVPLGRAPQPAPMELVAVDPPEPVVEEPVPVPAGAAPEDAAVDPVAVRGGLEALLFVVDAPVDEVTLAAALRCPVGQVRAGLAALAAEYDQRRAGVTLRRVGEGWRVYTREEHADVVERHLLEGQRSRLTQAALETLAVIAYRQPVTRARVSAIRGVGVDAVVRTLVNRGLIRECGTDPDTGGGLYATTELFLERLGLTGLDELPELAPLLPETSTVLDEHPDA
ncbi:segregation and condensation protein B [Modestobacter sp. DSM 44400]|uniref:SMC-Scp complex subunit ScpB n=1 Tax=Modestobacter sp. DSM 44400 TaxID=1550230 RepID=UPI00089BDA4D|nr:SMC-Scp complex subunit ScpB [Modestobacter sp. DSM 44400]SDX98252.1 segregation and condensation protein B [Modestobacter sp. DSM 44400]